MEKITVETPDQPVVQLTLFPIYPEEELQDAELVTVDTQIELNVDPGGGGGSILDPDEIGDGKRKADKKTYVLPEPGTPGFQLLLRYQHLGLKVFFALDTEEHIFTQEEVDRAVFEIEYRINAMKSLMRFESDFSAVAELNAELPGLVASILRDVSDNSRWLDEDFRLLEKDSGITYHIKCKKLPKFVPAADVICAI